MSYLVNFYYFGGGLQQQSKLLRFSLFTHFYPIVNLANPWHWYVVCFVWRSLANPCHWDHPGANPISAYSFHWKKFIFESVFIFCKWVNLECTKEDWLWWEDWKYYWTFSAYKKMKEMSQEKKGNYVRKYSWLLKVLIVGNTSEGCKVAGGDFTFSNPQIECAFV